MSHLTRTQFAQAVQPSIHRSADRDFLAPFKSGHFHGASPLS